jgi:hypothetical protein
MNELFEFKVCKNLSVSRSVIVTEENKLSIIIDTGRGFVILIDMFRLSNLHAGQGSQNLLKTHSIFIQ